MRRYFNLWRYYTFGREQYTECIKDVFYSSLLTLRKINLIVAALAVAFVFFPIVVEGNILKGCIYLIFAFVAIVLRYIAGYVLQTINIRKRVIYLLVAIYYFNLILLGAYISIWSNTGNSGSLHVVFIICSFLLFVNPPLYNLILTLCGVAFLVTSSIILKDFNIWIFDLMNTVIAGIIGLIFTWRVTKVQLGYEIVTSILEADKERYFNQSTVDELTQLKNRRDFMQTFQRYLSHHRTSDDWLCIAIADIDFFKKYNDHYGHPQGDECLRSIGKMLNQLKDDLGIYVSRIGGEEFAVLWFEKESSPVDKVINQWIDAVRDLKMPHKKSSVSNFVTMSIGVYRTRCCFANDTTVFYDLADEALYVAKNNGRNRAVISGENIEQYTITPKNS
ncbi:MAG: GGDEF domain-containing protein [Treponema sp.]|jgi:diguanylate cyclase (GGDEF)-like protein|nr:GGDEF domain-containing protein [Treponema sp.]